MGRFYQTDKPVFVEDVIYKPNLDLAAKLLLQKEKELQAQEAIADKLYNINFNYLNSEEDKANASRIKSYFQAKADDLIRRMQSDPMNSQKYQNELRALTREYTHSKTQGDISKLEGSYNAYNSWDKVNEEICKEQPALCTALKNEAWNKWGGNSIARQWNQERALKGLDLEEIEKGIQKLEADIIASSQETTDGRYIYTNGGERKILSREDIRNYARNMIMSSPENMAFMKQSDRVGQSSYLDQFGNIRESGTLDKILQGFDSYAYNQIKKENKMRENEYGKMYEKFKYDMALKEFDAKNKKEEELKTMLGIHTQINEQTFDTQKVANAQDSAKAGVVMKMLAQDTSPQGIQRYNLYKEKMLELIKKEIQNYGEEDIISLISIESNNPESKKLKELEKSGFKYNPKYVPGLGKTDLIYNKNEIRNLKNNNLDLLAEMFFDNMSKINVSSYYKKGLNLVSGVNLINGDIPVYGTSHDKFENLTNYLFKALEPHLESINQTVNKTYRTITNKEELEATKTALVNAKPLKNSMYYRNGGVLVPMDSEDDISLTGNEKLTYGALSQHAVSVNKELSNNNVVTIIEVPVEKVREAGFKADGVPDGATVALKFAMPDGVDTYTERYINSIRNSTSLNPQTKRKLLGMSDTNFNDFIVQLDKLIDDIDVSKSGSLFYNDKGILYEIPPNIGGESISHVRITNNFSKDKKRDDRGFYIQDNKNNYYVEILNIFGEPIKTELLGITRSGYQASDKKGIEDYLRAVLNNEVSNYDNLSSDKKSSKNTNENPKSNNNTK